MAIGEICKREVISVTRETTIIEAARLMRKHHVGDVIVIKEEGERRRPIGIVTDRDVLVEVVATGLDPAVLTVGDIMVGHFWLSCRKILACMKLSATCVIRGCAASVRR